MHDTYCRDGSSGNVDLLLELGHHRVVEAILDALLVLLVELGNCERARVHKAAGEYSRR